MMNEISGFSFSFLVAVILQMDLNLVADRQTEFSSEKDGDAHLKPAGAGRLAMPMYCVYLAHDWKHPVGHAPFLKVTSPEVFTK